MTVKQTVAVQNMLKGYIAWMRAMDSFSDDDVYIDDDETELDDIKVDEVEDINTQFPVTPELWEPFQALLDEIYTLGYNDGVKGIEVPEGDY